MTTGASATLRVKASPLARKRARAAGLSLESIRGTGPGGRIVARDIALTRHHAGPAESPLLRTGDRKVDQLGASVLQQPRQGLALRPMRETLAQDLDLLANDCDALAHAFYPQGTFAARGHDREFFGLAKRAQLAQAVIPHLHLRADVRLDELLRARQSMNGGEGLHSRRISRLTVLDFVVKAMGLALQQVPEANASWTEAAMLHHRGVDVGVAVPAGQGNILAVIQDANVKSLAEISVEIAELVDEAAAGRYRSVCGDGGVTTVHDLSHSGAASIDVLVMPPQSSALAFGAVRQIPVADGDTLVARPVMGITLSVDQRVIGARVAAETFKILHSLIENPLRMLA